MDRDIKREERNDSYIREDDFRDEDDQSKLAEALREYTEDNEVDDFSEENIAIIELIHMSDREFKETLRQWKLKNK